MNDAAQQLPDDLSSALAALAAERSRRITAEAEAATRQGGGRQREGARVTSAKIGGIQSPSRPLRTLTRHSNIVA
jgi:hypothetical protein